MKVPKNIFRAYDIRGIYPDELNADVVEHLGKAFGTLLAEKVSKKSGLRVVVGQDSRKSSPELTQRLISGLVSTGCVVVDVGISLTPIIHFLTCTKDFDAGIEVTASHNPKQFNGLRMDFKGAQSLAEEEILGLRELVESESYLVGDGSVEKADLFDEYLNWLKDHFSFDKSLKAVVDCGHGTTSYFVERLFKELKINVDPIFCTVDSEFPRGVPDPEKDEFMASLQDHVVTHSGDVGFAFDEDGDRFGVVDNSGNLYDTDMLILLFAKHVLKENQGAKIVFDVKCSNLLPELIKKWGGVPKMIRTGHPYFIEEIKNGAILGGEFSGHVYFGGEYFGFDDGIYAACKILEVLNKENRPLSEIMGEFPTRVGTPELKVACSDDKKFEVIKDIKAKILEKKSDFLDVLTIDGIRVLITDSEWFLIRASNTSPYISVRAEAQDEKQLQKILGGVKNGYKYGSF